MFCKITKRCLTPEYKNLTASRLYSASKERWDLVSSVCLERKPIITRELNDIETKYSKAISDVEYENSYKSDHEIRKIKDQLLAEKMKNEATFYDSDKVSLQTAQEYEDSCNEELKKFSLAKRVTQEDIKCDVSSTNRKLSESLLLIVKQNIGKKSTWVLPQGIHQEGETMRQTAERVLSEICGSSLQTKFLGNAPCGFYKYRYPKSANKFPSVGMKIFFFKAQLLKGNVSSTVCPDFQWLSHNELSILPKNYLKSVQMFIVENEGPSSLQA
ncbi:39S ribosomal protein L46, mitochondrial [Homalodisca vitripennis]|uniref:39S ribosomal protein L46, mitochondrial n=1 Tax=Homalodisca vitripennis TaxID=197043 RepID=UPI001EEA039D|nr:39S ribosomal protein L46, mitochondrial [Homalodisca vitripennis]KAG8256854.1 39S ribosomal protein L46, mitochondrial [Homalodisca vitripennis]KAG8267820.1 39S ribosomal protein L46, mitochondrial [Homalodisca vitripennis]